MRNHCVLFIAGALMMSIALMLAHHSALPDFLDGLIFGVGAGLLFLFVWRIGPRFNRSAER